MSHYTTQELESLSVKEVKAICVELGLVPSFRKSNCIAQITELQFHSLVEELVNEEEVEEAHLTCSTCPYFQQYDESGRGWCSAFDHMARTHHEKTSACPSSEAVEPQVELEAYIESQAQEVAPEPQPVVENKEGVKVLSSKGTHYYLVKDGRCTCTAAAYGKPCRHLAAAEGQVQVLTAPQAIKSVERHRFMVELASNTLDRDGVPIEFKTADVVVTEPTKEAINLLLSATNWLEGFTMVDYWKPDGDVEF